MIEPRWYQNDAEQAIYSYFEKKQGNCVVAMPTACHAVGTEILLYNGGVCPVEEIQINDLVMGPDSKPRKVLAVHNGIEEMCLIHPNKGSSFEVNINHILSLQETAIKKTPKFNCQKGGRIVNISIRDYLDRSNTFWHTHKLRRVAVDFPEQEQPPLNAWLMGALLGDGSLLYVPQLTCADNEIAERAIQEVKALGLNVKISMKDNNLAKNYIFVDPLANTVVQNRLTAVLRDLNVWGLTSEYKYVPYEFKVGSKQTRLNVLAGLIDTDGSLSGRSNYDFISKSMQLAKDVQFISRSLGLSASLTQCIKGCQNGFKGTYYRVCISGDCSIIPVVCSRKKAAKVHLRKNTLLTGFVVELTGEGKYYGFEVSGDNLYLTSDFIVHHNSGKSVVIAKFICSVLKQWSGQRVIVATHVEKLVKQNHKKMLEVWPNAPTGIYCAGIKRKERGKHGRSIERPCKDYIQPIIFGSIQSMVKHPELFGHRDLLLIDEAHLVGHEDDTNYMTFIAALKAINPNLKIIGFSATHWRMGRGLISDGPVFTDVCYDLTDYKSFDRLIKEGHLCTLIPKRTKTEVNVSDIKIVRGDYDRKDAEAAFDKDAITLAACKEIMEEGYDRKSWMIFASGIKHAEHIALMLQSLGIDSLAYHSKMPDEKLDKIWDDFINLRLRCIVNYGKLTTGVDHPALDLIGVLRATASSALWVQMLGRGMRPCAETQKENCLVLDFAGNTKRLGPINDPVIPKKKGQKEGVAPVRICEACGTYNHARATHCICCGIEFKFSPKITTYADTAELIKKPYEPIIEEHLVGNVLYNRHVKSGVPPMIKVDYWCGLKMFSEYICFEHGGFAANQARDWWKQCFPNYITPPNKTDVALNYVAQAKPPVKLLVDVAKRYPQIVARIF